MQMMNTRDDKRIVMRITVIYKEIEANCYEILGNS